jgi:hypothetical protein
MLPAECPGQVIGQLVLDVSPFDAAVGAHGRLESGVVSERAEGGVLEGLRRIDGLPGRDGLAAGCQHGLLQCPLELAPQPGRVALHLRPAVVRIGQREALLEQRGADGNGIRRVADTGPEDAVPGEGLIEKGRQKVGGEMSVGLLQGTQIALGEQMEDEPVIALGQDLGRDAARLLSDQDRPEIVLPPLLHPGDERPLTLADRRAENGLGLLDDGDGRDTARIPLGELLLVVLEDALQDHAREREPLRTAHLGDVHDAEHAV